MRRFVTHHTQGIGWFIIFLWMSVQHTQHAYRASSRADAAIWDGTYATISYEESESSMMYLEMECMSGHDCPAWALAVRNNWR